MTEAVEREVGEPKGGRELAFFAIGASAVPDGSERVDEILGEVFEERERRRLSSS